MKLNRRKFIGSSALLGGSAMLAPSTFAAPPQKKGGFSVGETRGHPSKSPAVEVEALAAHSINLQFSDLDSVTLSKAKYRILDLVGCAIAGVNARGNAALANAMSRTNDVQGSSIIGYPGKFSASDAAMVNAIIARSYDFEVMTVAADNRLLGSHHGPTTSMTALALCEKYGLSGQDFITALVLGDDIAARILAASGMDFNLGWDGSGVYPAIAAAAIASRLSGLSIQQTVDAFGITTDTIAGTIQSIWDGTSGWKFGQGLAARNGIFAADLAKGGWIGVGDALLAPYGFYGQYTPGAVHPEMLTKNLGKAFYAEEYFKPYPSCAATHIPHECALQLKAKHNLSASNIDSVALMLAGPTLTSTVAQPFKAGRDPHCSANFSIEWQVANAFLRGPTRQEHYTDTAINAPEMIDLLNRTSIQALPEGMPVAVAITVTTKDNQVLTEHIERNAWEKTPAEVQTTHEKIVAKFWQQIEFSGRISKSIGEEIIERVENIEKEDNIVQFVKLVS